jgi:hypothetical protein
MFIWFTLVSLLVACTPLPPPKSDSVQVGLAINPPAYVVDVPILPKNLNQLKKQADAGDDDAMYRLIHLLLPTAAHRYAEPYLCYRYQQFRPRAAQDYGAYLLEHHSADKPSLTLHVLKEAGSLGDSLAEINRKRLLQKLSAKEIEASLAFAKMPKSEHCTLPATLTSKKPSEQSLKKKPRKALGKKSASVKP